MGGKLLTNYLKEVVSYRQWNMMDEFEVKLQPPSWGDILLHMMDESEVKLSPLRAIF